MYHGDSIIIHKSPNGDSRTAVGNVSYGEFQKATDMHREDVSNIMSFLADTLKQIGFKHDWTKKRFEENFYKEFVSARENGTKFTESFWYQNHIRLERHHISSYVHEDVDLLDVLEMIADCTSAGFARSGSVRPIEIDKDVLYKAFENTCNLIKNLCVLKD